MHSLIAYMKTLDDSLKLTAARLHFTETQVHGVCKSLNVELPPRQQKEVPQLCQNYLHHCFDYELKRGRRMTVSLEIKKIFVSEIISEPVPGKTFWKSFYAMISCTDTAESELGKNG